MTSEEVGWSVVQDTVAPVVVIFVTATELITGALAVVVNVELAEVADKFDEFAETTSKL